MLYPVCVHRGDTGSLGATVPDFPGCFSGADDWRELPRMVREAIEVRCEGEDLREIDACVRAHGGNRSGFMATAALSAARGEPHRPVPRAAER